MVQLTISVLFHCSILQFVGVFLEGRVHPFVTKFLTKPCHHFHLVRRMGIKSLIVSVRLNDSTLLASSVSADSLAVESAWTCAHTHLCTHYLLLIFASCSYYFLFNLHVFSSEISGLVTYDTLPVLV